MARIATHLTIICTNANNIEDIGRESNIEVKTMNGRGRQQSADQMELQIFRTNSIL